MRTAYRRYRGHRIRAIQLGSTWHASVYGHTGSIVKHIEQAEWAIETRLATLRRRAQGRLGGAMTAMGISTSNVTVPSFSPRNSNHGSAPALLLQGGSIGALRPISTSLPRWAFLVTAARVAQRHDKRSWVGGVREGDRLHR